MDLQSSLSDRYEAASNTCPIRVDCLMTMDDEVVALDLPAALTTTVVLTVSLALDLINDGSDTTALYIER